MDGSSSPLTASTDITVTTDLTDYAPGATTYILASNVLLGGTLFFQVGELDAGADGIVGTADDGFIDPIYSWSVIDGGAGDLDGEVNGAIETTWLVDPDGYYIDRTLLLRASDDGADDLLGTADDTVAQTTFTDGPLDITSSLHSGQSKSLLGVLGAYDNGNVTSYAEGDEINFRFSLASNATVVKAGQMQVGFSRETATVEMFDPVFTLGVHNDPLAPELEWRDGTATWVVAKIGDPTAGGVNEWRQILDITKSELKIIDGQLDVNRSGGINGTDDGALLAAITGPAGANPGTANGTNTKGFTVIDGKVDVDNDGTIDSDDDGRLWYSTDTDGDYDTFITIINGGLDSNADLAITATDDVNLATSGDSGGNDVFIYYHLQIAQDITGTTGSSQHSRLYDAAAPGDVVINGAQNVPIPASAVLRLPDITVNKLIDRDLNGSFEDTADAGEYQFTVYKSDGDLLYEPGTQDLQVAQALTDGSGAALFENLANGTYFITETQVVFTNGLYQFDSGSVVTQNGATGAFGTAPAPVDVAVVTVAAQTGSTQLATVTFNNELGLSEITIDVVKSVADATGTFDPLTATWLDANSPTGPAILVGEPVAFRFVVTNPNPVAVNVTVTDSDFDLDGLAGDAVDGAPGSGYQIVNLAAGASTTIVLFDALDPTLAVAGQHVDTATATATFSSFSATDTDPAHYFGANADIEVEKRTLDGTSTASTVATDFTNAADGANILAGETVTWIYKVTNDGNVALSSVDVIDSVSGVDPNFLTGDTGSDGILAVGETWYFTATGAAGTSAYSNTGTASGSFSDSAGHTDSASDSDTSSYFGANADIEVEKRTLDGTTASGTVAADFTNAADGDTILAGETVTWIYKVTNDGNVALSSVDVIDSVSGVDPNFLTGDTGSDSILSVGETWYFTAAGTAGTGAYSNTGTASGSFSDSAGHTDSASDSDNSSYFGANADIEVEKRTLDGTTASGTVAADFTNAADGDTILAGETVTWIYKVTNDGNVALSSVDVIDSVSGVDPNFLTGDTGSDSILSVGETWYFTAAGTAGTGAYSNTGTASGSFSDSAGHTDSASDSDNSSYFGANPNQTIDKKTQDVTAPAGTAGDGIKILVGHDIKWIYTVTNTGNVTLTDPIVDDNDAAITGIALDAALSTGTADGNFDPGDVWVYTATGTAVVGPYENTGGVTSTFTDDAGHLVSPLFRKDGSSYFGADPDIDIDKVTLDGTTDASNVAADFTSGADGANIAAGETVTWIYKVTNDGNVDLSHVDVVDSVSGVDPEYLSGDDGDDILQQSETWYFTATGTAGEDAYSNTGTATGDFTDDASHTGTASDSDTSSYFGADLSIDIDKRTLDGATDESNVAADFTTGATDGDTILSGELVTWIYKVTNDGNVALSSVDVIDSVSGVDPNFLTGDTGSDTILSVGETWYFTATGITQAGDYSNTGTASGEFTDTGSSATDSDTSSYFGANPQIQIDKKTQDLGNPNGTPGDDITVLAGETIKWIYAVSLDPAGNVPLGGIQLSDDQLGPVHLDPATVLTKTGGDQDALLEAGETWTYELTGTAEAGSYFNNVKADGTFTDDAGHSRVDTGLDSSSYFGADPKIDIDKVTLDGTTDASNVAADFTSGADGANIAAGETVTWIYKVTNDGNVDLSHVDVVDSVSGVDPEYLSGDDGDDILQQSETWYFTATGTAGADAYSNTGTATGDFTDDASHTGTASDSDTSSYFGADLSIDVEKRTLDGTTASGTVAADFTNAADGANILAGETVTWIYKVTNDGNVALSSVDVIDSVSGVDPNFLSGDTGSDSILSVGETWYFTATGTAGTGAYSNTGTASGEFTDTGSSATDSDTSSYFGANANIEIEKRTLDGTTGASAVAADFTNLADDGDTILTGETVTWIYKVTNDGNVALGNIVVGDDHSGVTPALLVKTGGDLDGLLEAGEAWYYTATGTSVADGYSNTGTASGSFSDSAGHTDTATDSDTSDYFGADPSIDIEKRTLDGTTASSTVEADFSNADDGIALNAGDTVTWIYKVTNDGNVDLEDILVEDDQEGTISGPLLKIDGNQDDVLNVGETWYYAASDTAIVGTYNNIGSVTADDYSDTAGHEQSVTDDDPSSYVTLNSGYVTDSSLCDFGETFKLLFTPDYKTGNGVHKLSDSNPGQFYYNMFYSGEEGENVDIHVNIPYPFSTQGAVPIHVYSGVTLEEHDGEQCFVPGEEITNFKTTFTFNADGSINSFCLNDLTVPDDILYVNIHLDYGLEKTTGWKKADLGNPAPGTEDADSQAGLGNPFLDIIEGTTHTFSHTVYLDEEKDSTCDPVDDDAVSDGSDFIVNDNIFKTIKGGGGSLQALNDDPIAGQKIIFTDSKGAKLGGAVTDADGWYFGAFTAPGKQQTISVAWDVNGNGKVDGGDVVKTGLFGGNVKYIETNFVDDHGWV